MPLEPSRSALQDQFQLKYHRLHCDIGACPVPATLPPMSTIAIYEADDLMRGLLEEWLKGAGYSVSAGIPCGVPSRGKADLVIVNICMPKHAGAGVADEIRAAHAGTPMIAISAQFRAGLSTAGATAQSLGVAQVLAKPLAREALLAAVGTMIGAAT